MVESGRHGSRVSIGRWTWTIPLIVFSDIGKTLATFMPLKSVFILAADSIPVFFPKWIQQLGVIWAGLLLIAVSGLLAALSTLADKAARKLDSKSRPIGVRPEDFRKYEERRRIFSAEITRDELARVFFISVLLIGVTVVSVLYMALVAGWLSLSGLLIAYRVHLGPRRAPFLDGKVQFASDFAAWVRSSALWVSVGAAIGTLILLPPKLGLTGILLAAVFSQRAQTGLGASAPLISSLLATGARRAEPSPRTWLTHIPDDPMEFLSSDTGKRVFQETVRMNGWITNEEYFLTGPRSKASLSLLARTVDSDSLLLLRIFSYSERPAFQHELDLRTVAEKNGWPNLSGFPIREMSIGGLPTMVVHLGGSQSKVVQPTRPTDFLAARAAFELWASANWGLVGEVKPPNLQKGLFEAESLLGNLVSMSGTRFQHAFELFGQTSRLRAHLKGNVPSLSARSFWSPKNFLGLPDSRQVPYDLTPLKAEPLGASWSPTEVAVLIDGLRAVPEIGESLPSPSVITVQSLVAHLSGALRVGDDYLANELCSQILQGLPSA